MLRIELDRTAELQKRRAAERAAGWIEEGMALGLGTGSTIRHLLDVIAEQRAENRWQRVVGVPTSEETARRARELGIPLATLANCPRVQLTIDGTDEVDPELNLIKGLGAALLREKIVASVSDVLIIIADESKRVERLGTRAPVPVEVDPFGLDALLPFFKSLGAEPRLRKKPDGANLRTDGGHWIVDCRFPHGIDDPAALEMALNNRPGVIENGLFIGRADAVIIAGAEGTRVLRRGSKDTVSV